MQLSAMRDYVRNVVDIDSTDISDVTMNTFIREGYNVIVYSEKRWPFYEVSTTFSTVADQADYPMSDVAAALSFVHDGVTFSGVSAPSNVGMREVAAMKTDNHVMQYIGYDVADIIYPLDSNSTGRPWYWSSWNSGVSASAAVTNQTIRLYPRWPKGHHQQLAPSR